MGDGCRLDGAEGGDVAYGDSVLGDAVNGSDVVELCRRADPPWLTRYDSDGGGANGVSSSTLSNDRTVDRVLCWLSLLLDEPVTSLQIFFRPFAFLPDRDAVVFGVSAFGSMRGHDSPRRRVGALLPMSTTSWLGCCWKYCCSR